MKNILKDVEIRFFVEFKSLSRFQGYKREETELNGELNRVSGDTYRFHNVKVLELS